MALSLGNAASNAEKAQKKLLFGKEAKILLLNADANADTNADPPT